MKKLAIFFVVGFIIIAIIAYMYLNYKKNYNEIQIKNATYEGYKDREIYGTDLVTVINKVVDDNKKNGVKKDDKGLYIDNGTNSVKMDIKFTDDDSIHTIEEIYSGGTEVFLQYYNQIRFKCTKIEYHNKTRRVSYMYFEQIAT